MAFPRLFPISYRCQFGSVATNGSSLLPFIVAPFAGEVVAASILNNNINAVTSGTTTGSSASFVVYKNASGTGSVISTFNGSGTTIATLGSASMIKSSTANGRFAAGDAIFGELLGGAANNASNAGIIIQIDVVYARETGAVPTLAAGPA